jgi:polysaccharide biosynthesis/export protein
LNDIGTEVETHTLTVPNEDYKVQSSDVLYIRIFSLNQEIVSLFNPGTSNNQNNTQAMTQSNLYFQGYVVNDSGYVKIPVIGMQYVLNKTESEIEDLLEISVKEYIVDGTVLVKLAGMKVTILGEVKNPGMHFLYQKEATIFDALAIANDLTDYANRSTLLVLRAAPNGTKSYRINISDKNILTSPAFYLQPNDMIYVEPIETKGVRLVAQDYATVVSVITTTITAISSTITAIVLINSLLKN